MLSAQTGCDDARVIIRYIQAGTSHFRQINLFLRLCHPVRALVRHHGDGRTQSGHHRGHPGINHSFLQILVY